jgi:hypothetical protein
MMRAKEAYHRIAETARVASDVFKEAMMQKKKKKEMTTQMTTNPTLIQSS